MQSLTIFLAGPLKVRVMRLPRKISPAAARRRSLLFDAALGILVGAFALIVAAEIGVVGFFALLCAVVLVPWYLLDGTLGRARRNPPGPAPRSSSRR